MNIAKMLIDFVYRVNFKRQSFEYLRDEKVLAADKAKGTILLNNKKERKGRVWLTTQQTTLLLSEKRIVFGKWVIPLEQVENAKLTVTKSKWSSGQVLKIDTIDNKTYNFSMEFNNEWTDQTVLKIKIEKGKAKPRIFKWLFRICLIAYLMYLIFT